VTNNKKISGIILLEVLIAAFILALCGSAILRIFSQEMAMTAYTRQVIIAGWVADNILVLSRLTPLPLWAMNAGAGNWATHKTLSRQA